MQTRQVLLISIVSAVVTVAVMIALLAAGSGVAVAQPPAPPSGQAPTGVDTFGGDGLPAEAGSPNFAALETGPDVDRSTAASLSYYYILGSHLQPRASSTQFAYDGNGCIHVTGGSDIRLSFPVIVPEGSILKYVRIYYKDTSAANMTVWLTTYDPGAASNDLVSVSSTGNSGAGTRLSPEITHTVDGNNAQYTLNYGWGSTDGSNQICGVRVAYYAPLHAASYLPMLRHSTAP